MNQNKIGTFKKKMCIWVDSRSVLIKVPVKLQIVGISRCMNFKKFIKLLSTCQAHWFTAMSDSPARCRNCQRMPAKCVVIES